MVLYVLYLCAAALTPVSFLSVLFCQMSFPVLYVLYLCAAATDTRLFPLCALLPNVFSASPFPQHSESQRARWISPPSPAFLLLVSCFFALQTHFTTNSILRFLNFPSSVSFVAIGMVSPKPFATIMFPSAPC